MGVHETTKAVKALRELERWLTVILRRGEPGLAWRYPEQRRFLFEGLPYRSMVDASRELLDRLEILEHGRQRQATRKTDLDAIALLARHGLTRSERWRGRLLIYDASLMVVDRELDERTLDDEPSWSSATTQRRAVAIGR